MRRKWISKIVIFFFILQMVIPVIGLMIFSIDNEGLFTLSSYQTLFTDPSFLSSLMNSLGISLVSVVLTILLVTPPIWYGYLYSPRILRVLEAMSFITFVLPGVVLGLAYVQFFSNPPFALAGTPTLLPFAFTLFGMPYYMQSVLNRLRHSEAKLYHDVARSLGSSNLRSLLRVQVPLLAPGILIGSILVFSIGMGEFTITQLTTGGSFMTLPIYLQVDFQNNPLAGAAMAVIALLIAIVLVSLTLGTFRRRKKRREAIHVNHSSVEQAV
nr:ABC transporter permease subunit [Bacilli bacterium]